MEAPLGWIQLVAAVGVGAIVTKLMDVLWLQRVVQDSERTKWYREQRLKAYSELSRALLADPWLSAQSDSQVMRWIADAVLVSSDDSLVVELREYYPAAKSAARQLNQYINNGTSSVEQRAALRLRLSAQMQRRADDLIDSLRKSI